MLPTNSNCRRSLTLAVLLSLWLASPALSQAQFYQGKTLTILQSSDPGDTSDTMVRATIPVLRKHIPGEPTIAYQYMPAAAAPRPPTIFFTTPSLTGSPSAAWRRTGRKCRVERGRSPLRSRQTDLSGLRSQHLPLGFYHPARCRLCQLGSTAPSARNTHRRPGGRPFQLFRRPPVCLADRPERTKNARRLFWK